MRAGVDSGDDDATVEKEAPFQLSTGKYTPAAAVHAVFANQFPIGPYSGLLTPFVTRNLPQVLTAAGLRVLFEFVAEFTTTGWRFGFNSLGAAASVNHLHFQFFHLDPASQGSLPVERISQSAVRRPRHGTQLWTLRHDWPLRGLVYRGLDPQSSSQLIGQCAAYLRKKGLPHTLLVAADRAYLFPRKPLDVPPQFGGGKPGLLECSGEYIMATLDQFASAGGEEVRAYLAENVTVGPRDFAAIVEECASFFPPAG